jgi:multisubunit Na+/H+ antiporter MnhG subunit
VDVYTLARAVRVVTAVVVLWIVVAILLHVLEANQSNAIVSLVDDVARWLTQPFHGLFTPDGEKLRIAVNWGLAAVVYAIVGSLIARLLARSAGTGRVGRPWRRARA